MIVKSQKRGRRGSFKYLKKTFYVKLKLGEEEYASSGPSIKKAQHAAATASLEKTQFKHPPPKPPKSPTDTGK